MTLDRLYESSGPGFTAMSPHVCMFASVKRQLRVFTSVTFRARSRKRLGVRLLLVSNVPVDTHSRSRNRVFIYISFKATQLLHNETKRQQEVKQEGIKVCLAVYVIAPEVPSV